MVTIIVPIYNAGKYLNQCLTSICMQSYEDIEIILVNDGSKDDSMFIAESFARKDSRVKLISQENRGVSNARNKGLDFATGDYVMFVDADDWIDSQTVELLVENLSKYNVDIICCQIDYEENKTNFIDTWSKTKTIEEFLIHKNIRGFLGNKLFKKDLIGDIRFDENIKYGEDALFMWQLLMKSSSLSNIPNVLYHFTFHEDSATGGGSYKIIRKDCIKVWDKIVQDTTSRFPSLEKVARAQLGNMAFFSLYEMGYYNYKNKEHEKYFLETLRKTIFDFCKSDFISFSKKILALVFLCNTHIGRRFVLIKRKLNCK